MFEYFERINKDMISSEDIIRLQQIKGFGRKTISKFLSYLELKELDPDNFSKIHKQIKNIGINKEIDIDKIELETCKILEDCKKSNIKIISIYDEEYPQKLKDIEDRPLILYVEGNAQILNQYNNIAIVGTRTPTPKGYEISSILAEKLAEEECTVVSGFASGCDEAAHRGCLSAKGRTIAVIPSGHKSIYPKGSKALYNMILLNNGAVISELPPKQKAEKHTFIDRNRIIAALSEGIIVIEGGQKGGTSHTVKFSRMYGKQIAYTLIENDIMNNVQEDLLRGESIEIIRNFEDLIKFKNKSAKKC